MKKPLGIKVIITLHLLGGLVSLIAAGFMGATFYGTDDKTMFLITLVPIICIAILQFVATYGLWTIKKWGPNLSKWFFILGAFISLFTLIRPLLSNNPINMSDIIDNLLDLAITIAVARYLSRKTIKEMYK